MYTIYSKPNCKYCTMAKTLFETKELEFEEKILDLDYKVDELRALVPGVRTVPQIFKDGKLLGGYEDLAKSLS